VENKRCYELNEEEINKLREEVGKYTTEADLVSVCGGGGGAVQVMRNNVTPKTDHADLGVRRVGLILASVVLLPCGRSIVTGCRCTGCCAARGPSLPPCHEVCMTQGADAM
jgi:hypothetical protein